MVNKNKKIYLPFKVCKKSKLKKKKRKKETILEKDSIILLIIVCITLLILVIGAAYSYYIVESSNSTSSRSVITKTPKIGTISLSNPTKQLHINLNSTNMDIESEIKELYATDTENDYDVEEIPRSIGRISVIGGEDDVKYSCSFKLNINVTGTMKELLKYDDARIIFSEAFEGEYSLAYVPESLDILIDDLSGTNREEDIYVTVEFTNKDTSQNYLVGKNLNIDITTSDFTCSNKEKEPEYLVAYNSDCIFNGKGNDIVGSCADGKHIDHINTGYSLFSPENISRSFEIEFEFGDVDDSRFRAGSGDTIFNSLYESSPYPGILFRMQDKQWLFQVCDGTTNRKIKFSKDSVQKFKVIKIENKVYYELNGGSPQLALEMSTSMATFNTPFTIGTGYNASNKPMNDRFFVGTLKKLLFRFLDGVDDISIVDDNSYESIDAKIENFVGHNLSTVYLKDMYTFDGTNSKVLGTNINLFSTENIRKSYVVTFEIDSYDPENQPNFQSTFFNAKNESNNLYPGIVVRRSNKNVILMSFKDDVGTAREIQLPATMKRLNIIKKDNNMYYQYDTSDILKANFSYENYNMEDCFDIEATFGGNINDGGNYDRPLRGVLSNMRIKLSTD